METLEIIREVQEHIEKSVLDKLTPKIMQVADSVQNSNASLQTTLVGEVKNVVTDAMGKLEVLVSETKGTNEKRLDDFEKRIIVVEQNIWSKKHLYAIYGIMLLLFSLNLFLTVKEISLERNNVKIEKILKQYLDKP